MDSCFAHCIPRLTVEAGQHPRTPPHRPRPPCSLRPHCPSYPFLVGNARTKPAEEPDTLEVLRVTVQLSESAQAALISAGV